MNSASGTFAAAVLAIAMSLLMPATAPAHEFWISPDKGRIDATQTISASLKVGTRLNGESYPYLSNRFTRFEIHRPGETQSVTGYDGDDPALSQRRIGEGLNILAYETIPFRTTYDDWTKFERFLNEEGLRSNLQLHLDRQLPRQGFAERYIRHAKALVQVGPVAASHADTTLGLKLELVADDNPYRDDLQSLPVLLIWNGRPVAGRRINVYRRRGNEFEHRSFITDGAGKVTVPLIGNGEYLLNAVQLLPVDDAPVVWQSHWATLSFRL